MVNFQSLFYYLTLEYTHVAWVIIEKTTPIADGLLPSFTFHLTLEYTHVAWVIIETNFNPPIGHRDQVYEYEKIKEYHTK